MRGAMLSRPAGAWPVILDVAGRESMLSRPLRSAQAQPGPSAPRKHGTPTTPRIGARTRDFVRVPMRSITAPELLHNPPRHRILAEARAAAARRIESGAAPRRGAAGPATGEGPPARWSVSRFALVQRDAPIFRTPALVLAVLPPPPFLAAAAPRRPARRASSAQLSPGPRGRRGSAPRRGGGARRAPRERAGGPRRCPRPAPPPRAPPGCRPPPPRPRRAGPAAGDLGAAR